MGAWGYLPYDNDSAMDWLGGVRQVVIAQIEKGLRSKSEHEVIAAAALLLDLGETRLSLELETRRDKLYGEAHEAVSGILSGMPKVVTLGKAGRGKGSTGRRRRVSWIDTWCSPELARTLLSLLQHRLQAAILERELYCDLWPATLAESRPKCASPAAKPAPRSRPPQRAAKPKSRGEAKPK